jgi:hypothetical protein
LRHEADGALTYLHWGTEEGECSLCLYVQHDQEFPLDSTRSASAFGFSVAAVLKRLKIVFASKLHTPIHRTAQ